MDGATVTRLTQTLSFVVYKEAWLSVLIGLLVAMVG